MYRIKIVGVAGHVLSADEDPTGTYIAEYDPDAHGGEGHVTGSKNPRHALLFKTHREAIEFALRPSTVRPVRPDGLPNRPLTAFMLLVERDRSGMVPS